MHTMQCGDPKYECQQQSECQVLGVYSVFVVVGWLVVFVCLFHFFPQKIIL